eukprot:CAMPEP_0119120478 /NCGR_PEP_ID=MMETSP1310-20130426/1499_1 /TAXON_ID=464262 /ORGANISM="Genus nov. species nov., Strain RCC2339" /LENGTH=180 /DNA_ID=CAMNT_0007109957 /DNA_START=104 /DNA_END=646 /DNA_ORIENTATION=-
MTSEGSELGFLDPTRHRPRDNLQEGETLDVPLWLAKALTDPSKGFCRVNLPAVYGADVKNALLAAPGKASFASSPYYYEVALELNKAMDEEARDPLMQPGPDSLLFKTYSARYVEILGKCDNWKHQDLSTYALTLTASERNLLGVTYHTVKDYGRWRSEESGRIEASHVVSSGRKRKRVD